MINVLRFLLILAGLFFIVGGAIVYSGPDRFGVVAFGICLIIIASQRPLRKSRGDHR